VVKTEQRRVRGVAARTRSTSWQGPRGASCSRPPMATSGCHFSLCSHSVQDYVLQPVHAEDLSGSRFPSFFAHAGRVRLVGAVPGPSHPFFADAGRRRVAGVVRCPLHSPLETYARHLSPSRPAAARSNLAFVARPKPHRAPQTRPPCAPTFHPPPHLQTDPLSPTCPAAFPHPTPRSWRLSTLSCSRSSRMRFACPWCSAPRLLSPAQAPRSRPSALHDEYSPAHYIR
jgi:hypothetical protein